MAKVDSEKLVDRVKQKNKPERANYTFRLNTALMDNFKEVCEDQEVTPTSVLEEFMESFTKDLAPKKKAKFSSKK